MYQCVDCGNDNWQHVCPKHPSFKVQEPGLVMVPRSAEALAEENAKLVLQNDELWDHLMNAWGVIANAGPEGCLGNWKKMDPQWVEVAEKWRDKWHDMRKAVRVPLDQVIEELDKKEKRVDETLAQTPQIAWAIAAKRRPCWNCKPIHVDPPRECGCVCHT